MPNAARWIVLVAIPLVLAGRVVSMVRAGTQQRRAEGDSVRVTVATLDIAAGTPLRMDEVETREVPRKTATASFVGPESLPALLGRPLRVSLKRGDLLHRQDVAPGSGP